MPKTRRSNPDVRGEEKGRVTTRKPCSKTDRLLEFVRASPEEDPQLSQCQ